MAERSQPSSDPSKQSRPRPAGRIRASKACRRCNEKRVKCDASERGLPCTRCIQRREPDCRLIQSRRGVYARNPRSQLAATVQNSVGHKNVTGHKDGPALVTTSNEPGDYRPASVSRPATVEPSTPGLASRDTEHQRLSTQRERGSVGGSYETAPQQGDRTGDSVRPDAQQPPVEPAFASAQDQAGPEPSVTTSPVTNASTECMNSSNSSSYRNTSWNAVFNHLLEDQREGKDVLDKCSITYLGESFPLSTILQDLQGEHTGRPRLHHPRPYDPANEQVAESSGGCHPSGIGPHEHAFLEAKGAFSAPANNTMDALVDVFLDRVFPIYPIFNRHEFLAQHRSQKIPWILIHALCSVACLFCPPEVIYRAGFSSRQQARWSFYSKAKALFDMGYETNKVVLLQFTILMSFWGGGPTDNWNFYSWIGMGVTIAETIGCHRSMAGTSIKPQDRSLLKRLWWVLVLRDATSAALIGRPFKVNLDHSDVDALSPEDFEHDMVSPAHPASQRTCYSVLYQIHVIQLTIILHRIIIARFQPRRERPVPPGYFRQMLEDWRKQLPPELNWSGSVPENLNIFASTLCSMYNHYAILTDLDRCSAEPTLDSPSDGSAEQSMVEEAMNEAAQQISSVVCSVVTRSAILLAPHELFHGVFMAAAVFYMQTKSVNQIVAQLGVSGLRNCKLVFQASRETWDPSPWFIKLLDKGIFASHPTTAEERRPLNGTSEIMQDLAGASSVDISMNAFLPFGNDMWQDPSVLCNLFEVPPNASSLAMGVEFGDRSSTSWLGVQPEFH